MIPVAFCFVSRDDFSEWCRVNSFPPDANYDAWLKAVEQFRDRVVATGGRAVQVDVKPTDFAGWCQSTGRKIDSSARADYAAFRIIDLDPN